MKKTFLFATLLGFAFSYAQMSVKKQDGTPMQNGDVYSFSSANTDDSMLHFTVANTGASEDIKVKVLCESLVNTDGTEFQFCFGGNCMPFVKQGQNYPPNGYTIAAGSNSGNSDYFWNQKMNTESMSFVFKFYQVDEDNNEIGTPIRVTYKYTGAMAVDDTALVKAGVQLRGTVLKDNLELNVTKNSTISMFDFSGKQVLNKQISAGNNTVNVQSLQPGVYILNVVNAEGKIANAKIIKK